MKRPGLRHRLAVGRASDLWGSIRRAVAGAAVLGSALLFAGCGQPVSGGQRPVVAVSYIHSVSDEASEAQEVADLADRVLPAAAAKKAVVIAFTTGAAGFTAPTVLARATFDVSHESGGNPVLAQKLVQSRITTFMRQVKAGLAKLPYSQASDVFGGAAAAANFLDQFPGSPKTYVAFGDEMANVPTGCVLGVRDLSANRIPALIHRCSPTIPNFTGVYVSLAGAGFSPDGSIPTSTAEGLERLLRQFYADAGATVTLYGPVDFASVQVAG